MPDSGQNPRNIQLSFAGALIESYKVSPVIIPREEGTWSQQLGNILLEQNTICKITNNLENNLFYFYYISFKIYVISRILMRWTGLDISVSKAPFYEFAFKQHGKI